MTRFAVLVCWMTVWTAYAQFPPPPPPDPPPAEKAPAVKQKEIEPPEEDENQKGVEYSFNPLKAIKAVKVGQFYLKKGNLNAALSRFQEAEKWNPKYADAYLLEAETQEKLKDEKKARAAYSKYLELAPDGKEAAAVKKKLNSRS